MIVAKSNRLAVVVLVLLSLTYHTQAANFDVADVNEFQTALTTAQANGQDDTITVASGTYNVATSLTYIADGAENFSLTINGVDSDLCILDGGALVSILRINTQQVTADDNIAVTVSNMTFQNGNAAGNPSDGGALAIHMDDTGVPPGVSISVTGSEFYNNAADGDGGALYIRGDADNPSQIGILLDDLTIEGNQARGISDVLTGNGGGVQISAGTATGIMVRNVDVIGNTAPGNGAGIDIRGALGPAALVAVFEDVLFFNNTATGSISNGGGAAVNAVDLNVRQVGFVDNTASLLGGGLHLRDNTRMIVENSGFVGNEAAEGGGLATDAAIDSGLVLTNNTFADNRVSSRGGGAYLQRGGSTLEIYIYNNIFWGNFGEIGQDLYVNDDPADLGGFSVADILLFNNDFSSFETKCMIETTCTEDIQSGANIDANPMFVDLSVRPIPDVRLTASSPAIDAGLNSGAPIFGAPEIDFEGDDRPFDGNGDGTATIDIGMDEFIGMAAASADIQLAVTDAPDPVTEGQNVTYTATVTNNGTDDATALVLSATLDSRLSFVSVSATQGTCTESMGVVTCMLGDVANSGSATATIVATTPDIPEPLDVFFNSDVSATEGDPDNTNNSASITTMVVPQGPAMADLEVTKTDAPDPFVSGSGNLAYTLAVSNNGPDDATGVVLTDTLPVGVTFVSASASAGSCSEMSAVVTCDLGAIALNGSVTVTIVAVPDVVEAPLDISNTASVAGNELDPVAENNDAVTTTTVNPPSSDLVVTSGLSPAQPLINEAITYTVTTTNSGPSINTNVALSVQLPANTTFTSASAGCSEVSLTVTCDLGELAVGAAASTTISVVGPALPADLTFSANVSGDVAEPDLNNNSTAQQLSVIDEIDIVIEGTGEGTGSFGVLELLFGVIFLYVIRGRSHRLRRVPAALILCLAMSVPVASVHSQQLDWYAGGSVGIPDLDYDESDLVSDLANRGWAISMPNVDHEDFGWKVFGGVDIGQNFGVEAAYVDLGETNTRFGASLPPNQVDALLDDTVNIHPFMADGWTVSGVARIEIADSWEAFAKAGLFSWEADANARVVTGASGSAQFDQSGEDLTWSIGAKYTFGPVWRARVEWERFELDEPIDFFSVGIERRF